MNENHCDGRGRFHRIDLVDRLLGEGADVTVVDNFDASDPRAAKESNLALALGNPRCRLVELDIRDAEQVARLVDQYRPDVIVHLAARAGVRPSIDNPALYAEVNVLGTVHWFRPRPGLTLARGLSMRRARVCMVTGPMHRFARPTRSTFP